VAPPVPRIATERKLDRQADFLEALRLDSEKGVRLLLREHGIGTWLYAQWRHAPDFKRQVTEILRRRGQVKHAEIVARLEAARIRRAAEERRRIADITVAAMVDASQPRIAPEDLASLVAESFRLYLAALHAMPREDYDRAKALREAGLTWSQVQEEAKRNEVFRTALADELVTRELACEDVVYREAMNPRAKGRVRAATTFLQANDPRYRNKVQVDVNQRGAIVHLTPADIAAERGWLSRFRDDAVPIKVLESMPPEVPGDLDTPEQP
jgi:hypothetical protein